MSNAINKITVNSLEFDVVFYLMEQRRRKIDFSLKQLCSMEIDQHTKKKIVDNKKIQDTTNIWRKLFYKKTIYKGGEVKWKL